MKTLCKALSLLLTLAVLAGLIAALAEGLTREDDSFTGEAEEQGIYVGLVDETVPEEAEAALFTGDTVANDEEYLPIDETHFPDKGFRDYLIELLGADGSLTDGNKVPLSTVEYIFDFADYYVESEGRWISMRQRGIKSLQGIEYFPNLERLDCGENELTSLDLSHNIYLTSIECDANQITALDVSSLPNLQSLSCEWNRLTSLDVTHNPELYELAFDNGTASGGNRITSIDLSHNPNLALLYCGSNNLTTLDVSNNPALITLNCRNNGMTYLNASGKSSLSSLILDDNPVMTIDITGDPLIIECVEQGRQESTDGKNYFYVSGYNGFKFPIGSTIAYNGGQRIIQPTATPTPTPTATPEPTPTPMPETFTDKNGEYKINGSEATFVKAAKAAKTVTVPATIKVNGKKIKVTQIASKAFYKNKVVQKVTIGKNVSTIGASAFQDSKNLKTITIKTTKLTAKSVGKKAFKGINSKAVFACPKKKLEAYKKILLGAGAPKTATFR